MTKITPKSQAIDGGLYKLLCQRFPIYCDTEGRLQVSELAAKLSMSAEGVYRWLRSDEISKRGRKRLVELSESVQDSDLSDGPDLLTEDDLRPFL